MSDNVFAERLRTLREQKKFSQERLAELINVSIMTVRRWEWGQRLPRLDEMKKLTDILNVKADDFIEIDGKEYIHESGLYFLALFISEVEIARKFQRWVFGEVLPSVKTKGFYKL